MTTPLVVITMEGGVIQDISVSLQTRIVIVDYDVEGVDKEDLVELAGSPAYVADHGVIMPSPGIAGWLGKVEQHLASQNRGVSCGP